MNRCLLSLPNVWVLSEISPLRKEEGVPHVKAQMEDWYQVRLRSSRFTDCLREAYEVACERGKHLVIRDWPFCCFEARTPEAPTPPGQLVMLDALPASVPCEAFAFVRDAYDVFLSRPWGKGFPERYLKFVRALLETDMPRFKYESFCQEPERVMQELCHLTGLPFRSSFAEGFASQQQVTGDISLGSQSRGQAKGSIQVFPRRLPPLVQLGELISTRSLDESNRLLGYPEGYFSRPVAWPLRR